MLLQQLKYFVAVVETGSLSATANILFVTQPNLSKTISNLEDEYKAKLFNRTAKGMSLTPEGSILYQNAKVILKGIHELDVAFGLIKPSNQTKLSIATPSLSFVEVVCATFYRKYKNFNEGQYHVEIKNMSTESIVENVANLTCEIGFIYSQQQQMPMLLKLLKQQDLEYTELGVSDLYANIGPLNPFYDNETLKIEDIIHLPLICHYEKDYIFHNSYPESSYINLEKFDKVFFLNSDYAAIHFLRTTDAVFLGDIWSMVDISEFGIKTLNIPKCEVKFTLGWIKRKKENLSDEAENFIRIMDKYCKWYMENQDDMVPPQAVFKSRDFSFLDKF